MLLEALLRKPRHVSFKALTDVSFEVRRGEVLGTIVRNGAGKPQLVRPLLYVNPFSYLIWCYQDAYFGRFSHPWAGW